MLHKSDKGNTKALSMRTKRCRQWVFTINNYTEMDILNITTQIHSGNYYYFRKEVGSSGTPHLQGFLKFKNGKTMSAIKKILGDRIHLEIMRGRLDQNKTYCDKEDGDQYGNFPQEMLDKPEVFREAEQVIASYDMLYDWQKKVVDVCKVYCDARDRTVHWYWSRAGNLGKSELINYIVDNHKGIEVGGRKRDGLMIFYERWKARINTNVIMFDLERSKDNHVSYDMIECLKNCRAVSTKFECGMFRFAAVHVFVFANAPPDMSMLSDHKWDVVNIDRDD